MATPFRRELGLIVAWLVFPVVPVVLEDAYCQICTMFGDANSRYGTDPREWGWFLWVLMLGPLIGYGFLAGATAELPDDLGPPRRWWRRLAARRSVWVAIGPWWGFVAGMGIIFGVSFENHAQVLGRIFLPESIRGTMVETVLWWTYGTLGVATLAYGWLWPAWAALRRAARTGQTTRAFYRGIAVAFAFVGSLFGSFWAATAFWRSYFFDNRVVPLIVVALALATLSGCGNTITYGEVRRRELFHAMLVAWVLGLALMWRWWSRRGPRPPAP